MEQDSNALPTKEQASSATTDNLSPDVTLIDPTQKAVATKQPSSPQAALALTVSIEGLDIWKKPIDEGLLQTLAQFRHTTGFITNESINSYLVWLINSDLATIIRDVVEKRRG